MAVKVLLDKGQNVFKKMQYYFFPPYLKNEAVCL